jgi:acetyltransferase-like isoleucine patch superfamily enzyme
MSSQHLDHDWFSRPLPENVQLGTRTWLYSSYAFAHYQSRESIGLKAGSNTGLYHGTFFDLGHDATVKIGDFCSLVGVIFATNGRVSIGDYTFMAHDVVIADHDWSSPTCPSNDIAPKYSATDQSDNSIEIGANVWIGAQAIIIGSVKIGEGAVIGAGTLVTRDVPAYTVCAGNPMRILKSIPRTGEPHD